MKSIGAPLGIERKEGAASVNGAITLERCARKQEREREGQRERFIARKRFGRSHFAQESEERARETERVW